MIRNSRLSDDKKYTIFTSTAASNTVVVSDKPITGKLINDTFLSKNDLYEYSYSIIKNATLLEFDRVYSEAHKLDLIYSEQIKDSVNNLFQGKNSCVMFFGPADGGKSYLLRGGVEGKVIEPGLLGRVTQDLFNLVEISKQTNMTSMKNRQGNSNAYSNTYSNNASTTFSTYFAVKMSIYQVYMDQINDLLTNQYAKSLKMEKYADSEGGLKTDILDLTQKEVRSKKDYDAYLKEAVQYRKLLSQYLKVNEMKRKSHLVISLILEKRERVSEGYNKVSEKCADKFAQIDFVELASSNYGLNESEVEAVRFKNSKHKSSEMIGHFNDFLYKSTSKTFNSICNNVVSASIGAVPKYESKLTLSLKNTLRAESQIILLTCVLPGETPPKRSFKCLKFVNWLRNQVYNAQCNRNYKIKSTYEESENEEEEIRPDNRLERSVQRAERDNSVNYMNDMTTLKEYQEDKQDRNEEDEMRAMRERIKKKYPYINSENNSGEENRPEIKSLRTIPGGSASMSMNNSDNNLNVHGKKEYKLKEVEKSLRDLEAKSLEMSRCIENMRLERSRVQSQVINPEDSINIHSNIQLKQTLDFENERLKQEFATLKSDNIIFREDINRLSDINRHLEDEISRQRNRNLELAAENEHLAQEKLQMKNEIDKLNESVGKIKVQDHNMMEQLNQRFIYENKIRDLETEAKTLREDKQKFEVDYRVLLERHNELKKTHENAESELNYIKARQTQEVTAIEEKLEKMAKEIEFLQRENSSMRVNEERLRQEVNSLEKQRDNYRDKYQDYKAKNNLLNGKLNEVSKKLLFLILFCKDRG